MREPETVSIIVWTFTVGVMVAVSIEEVRIFEAELEVPFVADAEVGVSEVIALVLVGESVEETGVLTEACVPVFAAVVGVLVVGESAAFEVGVALVLTVVGVEVVTAFGEVVVVAAALEVAACVVVVSAI